MGSALEEARSQRFEMHSYSVRDVERLLGLSRSTIRSLINVGFVTPSRGARREHRFSFQDLIVLRAAKALIEARVSRRRIKHSLEELRRHLPEEVPLSGLSISAIGERVVVRDGTAHWQADDGQYLLGLDVSLEDGELRVVEHKTARPAAEETSVEESEATEDWFEKALELEGDDPRAAQLAYQRAVSVDPANSAAWINWGRLVHTRGGKKDAERIYRRALSECGPDPLLMFNLGVLLEDLGRAGQALEAYQTAIGEDPTLADCHYNLARLYESMGKPQHAIRHLGQYRRLVAGESR
jgi:tetratricopeptide (TPR) repeat protein